MSIPRKRMKDIKTHAGIVDQTFIPHKAFMRISCLEMEKAHRMRERDNARLRIDAIDARLKEIEDEKESLLNRIYGTGRCRTSNNGNNTSFKNTNNSNKNVVLKY